MSHLSYLITSVTRMNKAHNINLILFNVPKARGKWKFGSTGIFPPAEPMHLISVLSLWPEHTSSEVWRVNRPHPRALGPPASLHYWCFTSKRWFDTSSHLLGTFVMLLCNLKWTKTALRLKFWKVICLWHFWDRSLHKVCSIYIYLCLWENISVGQSCWLNCWELWHSSNLEILPFLFKVLGEFVLIKML